ncbi:hypothetical protein EDD15DRAFT_2192392 [Pisolithus albus]|nr:hypothetical protein EDD15DRAFT_2192392 [Pisolithus albus]
MARPATQDLHSLTHSWNVDRWLKPCQKYGFEIQSSPLRTQSPAHAAAPVSFFRATYGPADECGAHAVDLYSKITRHMAYANILHLRRATKFPTGMMVTHGTPGMIDLTFCFRYRKAFPRIIILFVHSYREQIGIMTSMTGGLPYDVRAGNTVVVAECFGGSGEVKSAPFVSSSSRRTRVWRIMWDDHICWVIVTVGLRGRGPVAIVLRVSRPQSFPPESVLSFRAVRAARS